MVCFLGFSTAYTNSFSEQLERRSSSLERHHREANLDFMLALDTLHHSVEAALERNPTSAAATLDGGLARLASCNDHLTAIGEVFVRTRTELFEQESLDPRDPLIARERHFPAIDFEGLYRELVAYGAALPGRLFWDDLVSRVRDGGARAGLRVLDRHLRELQSDLRTFVGEIESIARLPLGERAKSLHGATRGVAAVTMGFTRLVTTCMYFSMLCEKASELYEQDAREMQPAVAAAG